MEKSGFVITGIFDVNPEIIGKTLKGIKVKKKIKKSKKELSIGDFLFTNVND